MIVHQSRRKRHSSVPWPPPLVPIHRCQRPRDPWERRQFERCRRWVKGILTYAINWVTLWEDPTARFYFSELEHRWCMRGRPWPWEWVISIAARELDKLDHKEYELLEFAR